VIRETKKRIENLVKSKSNPLLKSYRYLIRAEFFSIEKQPIKQAKELDSLRLLLIENTHLNTIPRMMTIHLKLAELYCLNFEFDSSIALLKEATALYNGNYSNNYISINLSLAHCYTVKNQCDDATEIINHVFCKFQDNLTTVFKEEFLYLKAVNLIQAKKYKEALCQLSDLKSIKSDKKGYNLWIRIYRILCLIELKEYGCLDKAKESLRKYIYRLEKEEFLELRIKLILKILLALSKAFYRFKPISSLYSKDLEYLRCVDQSYSWKANTPEVLLFHDWFDSKKNNKDYTTNHGKYQGSRIPITLISNS